ncbi:unnamed protein product [Miscanthus lutarioriparius]|uniref:Uncharacterized protein n=1 Tax=Miscanthus lutarioriparius TaxID=422564 RepID=A0A811RWN7_9POAL|nr:unnamed protein product [Miscanthus lutarioriparius]
MPPPPLASSLPLLLSTAMHRLRPRRWSRGAGGAQPWRGVAGEGAGVEAAGAAGSATTRREQTPGWAPLIIQGEHLLNPREDT